MMSEHSASDCGAREVLSPGFPQFVPDKPRRQALMAAPSIACIWNWIVSFRETLRKLSNLMLKSCIDLSDIMQSDDKSNLFDGPTMRRRDLQRQAHCGHI